MMKTLLCCFLAAALTGVASAATVSSEAQQAISASYAIACAVVLSPTDKNFDAARAQMSPDFTVIDVHGGAHKRDDILALMKQQLSAFKATSCQNHFDSIDQTAPDTIVIVDTGSIAGSAESQGNAHTITQTTRSQDTWKNIGGKWLQTQSKNLHVTVTVDGKLVQDEGQ